MSRIRDFYLGKPGKMQAIRSGVSSNAPSAFSAVPSRNEVATKLLSGSTSTSKTLNAKRAYTAAWNYMTEDASDLLEGFVEGQFGVAPFALVDPNFRNVLDFDVSTFGQRTQADPGWIATGGLNGPDDTIDPPDGVVSGVYEWTPTVSAYLFPGPDTSHANLKTAPVYLPLEHTSWSVWMMASAPLLMTSALYGYSATTALSTGMLASRTCAVTTAWQKFNLTLSPGASADLVLPRLTAPGSLSGQALYLAGAQLEYADAASKTQRGYGSPRVNIVDTTGRAVALVNDSTGAVFSSGQLVLAQV